MGNRYWNKNIPIGHQVIGLQKYWPQGRTKIIDCNRTLLWSGDIQPSPFSRTYEVILRYSLGGKPTVIVVNPDLSLLAKGESIPHIYPDDSQIKGTVICLYLPSGKNNNIAQWHPTIHFLAETIMPWTSLWLYYYEYWLLTGKWEGGGEHPDV